MNQIAPAMQGSNFQQEKFVNLVDPADPTPTIDSSASVVSADEGSAGRAAEHNRVTPVCEERDSTFVLPPPEETGAFPTLPAISKREEIRRRLREKEKALNKLIIASKEIKETYSFGDSTLDDDSQFYTGPTVTTVGKEEADRREAIRVLSLAALDMRMKLKHHKEKTSAVQEEVGALRSSLNVKELEKSLLEHEIRRLRDVNKSTQMELATLQKRLEDKSTLAPVQESEKIDRNHDESYKKPKSVYEDVIWTQRHTLSKDEQIEYLEYLLLAHNHEINDLKQELDFRLRRIVELEVDLEMHDDHFILAIDEYSRVESVCGNSAPGEILPRELLLEHASPWRQEKQKGALNKMMSWRKTRSRDKRSLSNLGIPDDSMADRLSADMKNLEMRYKQDKIKSRNEVFELKKENEQYRFKIYSLERDLKNSRESESTRQQDLDDAPDSKELHVDSSQTIAASDQETHVERPPTKTTFLEERVAKLEIEREIQANTISDLRAQISSMEKDAESRALQAEQVINNLRLENETQELKMAAMHLEIHEMTHLGGSNRSITGLHVNAAAGLEAKLLESVSEVVALRKYQEIRDRKLEKLRSEIIELRVARMQYEKAVNDLAPSHHSTHQEINGVTM